MANRGMPPKMIRGTEKVDVVDAMYVEYNTTQKPIKSSDEFDIMT